MTKTTEKPTGDTRQSSVSILDVVTAWVVLAVLLAGLALIG